MVMPSSSIVAPFRPHIGSEVGGRTCFGAIPESQWPALPAQQGIFEPEEALTIGSSGAVKDNATRRHKTRRMPLAIRACLLCFMVDM
jgi:hypothetical protein